MLRTTATRLTLVTAVAASLAGGTVAATTLPDPTTAASDTSTTPTVTVDGSASNPSVPVSTADPAVPAFPVTIETKYGPVTIEAEPQRVVSVGYTDQDSLLALGVVPVGIREWYGNEPYATWPWATDELGDATPEVLAAEDLNFEAIAALEPDLIVAVSAGLPDDQFATLNDIAPTIVAGPGTPDFGIPWRDGFRATAAAVGRTDEAEVIIADLEARFAEARAAHPEFAGKQAAVGFWFNDQPGVYASNDTRASFLAELGFETPAEYDELAGDSFFASFSAEQVSLLDVDVLVWVATSDTELQPIADSPLLDQLAVRQEGREVFPDALTVGAFSFNSPLSIDHLLDHLVPQLAVATDDDPATVTTASAASVAPGTTTAG